MFSSLRARTVFTVCCAVAFQLPGATYQSSADGSQPVASQRLAPTVHAALPHDIDDYWLVPSPRERKAGATTALATAAAAYAAGDYSSALASAQHAATGQSPLTDYALYYQGLALLRLTRAEDAEKAFGALIERKPGGYLAVAAALGRGEAAESRGRPADAAGVYEKLTAVKTIAPEEVLARLGRAALAAGDKTRAAQVYLRIYYEFPLSDAAAGAATALSGLQDQIVRTGYKGDLSRALLLFGARRYQEARTAFQDLQKQVSGGDDREVVDLRIAECEYFLKRYAAARDGLQPYLENASRRAEARFFYLSALRELGAADQFGALTRQLVADFPDSSWAEEALNNLGTHYILANEDELAAQVFREVYEKFPTGQHAERAAWKYGWYAYKTAHYDETERVFSAAAASFPRSDYRPAWLYWSARARARSGDRAMADRRMRLVFTDYLNSYYGRLARRQLAAEQAARLGTTDGDDMLAVAAAERTPTPPASEPPANAALIRQLLAAGLLDDAVNELRYAQRISGSSPVIDATVAWVYHERGEYRRAIILMRRAYPQHLAVGGEGLPAEILQTIFPLTYWDTIQRNARLRGLDPYLVAALIAQESTFDPQAHSSANAWGLMQIVPATGRRLARAVGIRRFKTPMLTNPDVNIRLGTLYFSGLVKQFGGTYYALASYNAGESRVVRWKMERPGLEDDEFIDDIPFPETQNYVKRILGTAEDYRRLYRDGATGPHAVKTSATTKAPVAAKNKAIPSKKAAPKKRTPPKNARRNSK
jgi:peptidoglycan lytic transglycosylase